MFTGAADAPTASVLRQCTSPHWPRLLPTARARAAPHRPARVADEPTLRTPRAVHEGRPPQGRGLAGRARRRGCSGCGVHRAPRRASASADRGRSTRRLVRALGRLARAGTAGEGRRSRARRRHVLDVLGSRDRRRVFSSVAQLVADAASGPALAAAWATGDLAIRGTLVDATRGRRPAERAARTHARPARASTWAASAAAPGRRCCGGRWTGAVGAVHGLFVESVEPLIRDGGRRMALLGARMGSDRPARSGDATPREPGSCGWPRSRGSESGGREPRRVGSGPTVHPATHRGAGAPLP